MMHRLPVVLALLASPALAAAGCTPIGVVSGVGAVAGAAAVEERGIAGSLRDAHTATAINDAWLRHDLAMFDALNLQIYEGRVLVTGVLDDPDKTADAIRLAWQAPGVVEVINEVSAEGESGLESVVEDAWISTRVNAGLLFAEGVLSLNYSVEVVDGTVFLIGIAQDETEHDRALEVVRNTPHVRKVVSHVITRDDPRRYGNE